MSKNFSNRLNMWGKLAGTVFHVSSGMFWEKTVFVRIFFFCLSPNLIKNLWSFHQKIHTKVVRTANYVLRKTCCRKTTSELILNFLKTLFLKDLFNFSFRIWAVILWSLVQKFWNRAAETAFYISRRVFWSKILSELCFHSSNILFDRLVCLLVVPDFRQKTYELLIEKKPAGLTKLLSICPEVHFETNLFFIFFWLLFCFRLLNEPFSDFGKWV